MGRVAVKENDLISIRKAIMALDKETSLLDEDDMSTDSVRYGATQQSIAAFVNAKWNPATYAGGETTTLGNGFIIKLGSQAVSSDSDGTVTFGTAFPTGIVEGFCCYGSDEDDHAPYTHTLTVSSMKVHNYSGSAATIRWFAFGY